jgi:hypothetical protein
VWSRPETKKKTFGDGKLKKIKKHPVQSKTPKKII